MISLQLNELSQNECMITIQAKKQKNNSTLETLTCFIPLPLPKDF